MSLPPPVDLGAPATFTAWRPHQADAVLAGVCSDRRFSLLIQPTGSGKSLCYLSMALLSGGRTVILTATKALQQQLVDDFASVGLADVRGANAYPCTALLPGGEFDHLRDPFVTSPGCDQGPCRAGVRCGLKGSGCAYYDAVRAAGRAQIVVTNYAYWCAIGQHTEDALGKVDLLVLDEAHAAPDALCGFLTAELTGADLAALGTEAQPEGLEPDQYQAWGAYHHRAVTAKIQQLEDTIRALTEDEDESQAQSVPRSLLTEVAQWKRIEQPLSMLTKFDGSWVYHLVGPAGGRGGRGRRRGRTARFGPSWPGPWAESVLFRGVPRVVLTSATAGAETCRHLGLDLADVEVLEFPSAFDKRRRPVIIFSPAPSVRMRHTMPEWEIAAWVDRIDTILAGRVDRKGIIHTVSYARAKQLQALSTYGRRMIIAEDAASTRAAIAAFRGVDPPALLVSPAVSTGHDFPYAQCAYQIIAKVPFPNTQDPLVKRRAETDPDYGMYVAMQGLVQATGRGMRAPDDVCETFIVDDQIKWCYRKHKRFAPAWFREAIRWTEIVPPPPPLEGTRLASEKDRRGMRVVVDGGRRTV